MAAHPKTNVLPQASLSDQFSYDNFKTYIGETFFVYGGQGLHTVTGLKLVAVDSLHQNQETEQFATYFQGPAIDPLEGGVYLFQHPIAGEFYLLITPTTSDSQNRNYRVDFNLLR